MIWQEIQLLKKDKGYPCVVSFQPLAFRTGYVRLPKISKYYGKDYNDIPIRCHGGLTYGRSYLFGQDDEETWWIGFDCGHYGDGYDVEQAKEYYQNDEEVSNQLDKMGTIHSVTNAWFSFRTLDYVESECMSIVDQIIELESANPEKNRAKKGDYKNDSCWRCGKSDGCYY